MTDEFAGGSNEDAWNEGRDGFRYNVEVTVSVVVSTPSSRKGRDTTEGYNVTMMVVVM
jgi:hypothetical protein